LQEKIRRRQQLAATARPGDLRSADTAIRMREKSGARFHIGVE
jgi:hypothetical protein